uniref:Uncharacterized protein n=1 Tax=Salix viminalis TaxID=40686 RepID=A0A6N2N0P1_SALVM
MKHNSIKAVSERETESLFHCSANLFLDITVAATDFSFRRPIAFEPSKPKVSVLVAGILKEEKNGTA